MQLTLKNIINAVRTSMASGDVKVGTTAGSDECSYPATGAKVAVVLTRANLTSLLERGGDKSSFGRAYAETGSNAVKPAGYVVIENSNDKFSYSISLVDAGGNGIAAPIKRISNHRFISKIRKSNIIIIKHWLYTMLYKLGRNK